MITSVKYPSLLVAALVLIFGSSVVSAQVPDLQVDQVAFAKYVPPEHAKAYDYLTGVNLKYGDKIYLVCAFSNRGGPLKGTWKIGYYVNNVLVYNQTFGDIAAGAKQDPAGWYVIDNAGANSYTCKLDYENSIREKTKSNNSMSKSFTVERHVALSVTLHPQETNMWCWAASGEMVMDFLGHDVAQCVEANNEFGKTYCCNVSPTDNTLVSGCPKLQCADGGWPEFDKYGFTFNRTHSTALTWDQLVHQIAELKKPVAFSWAWTGGGGHMMVARGIHTVDATNWVEMNDPWAPCVGNQRTITYDEYVARLNDHTHWDDFYDVTYTGGH